VKDIRTRVRKPNNDFALIKQDVNTDTRETVFMDFAKIVQGMKFADDAVLDLGRYRKANSNLTDRDKLLQALKNKNYDYLRDVSGYFFNNSGIYARICRYLSFLLTYDWMVTPYVVSESIKEDKVLTEFNKVLLYLDNLNVKSTFSNVSLEVVKNGVFYGIIREDSNFVAATLQQLPTNYCRSRYKINGRDAVEFNVKYFDEQFTDINEKLMVIKSFPKEFAKSYMAYKSGNIQLDRNDNGAWFLCDPLLSVRFTFNGNECPIFIAAIPAILDLDEAKEVDKKKMLQELLKIVIQKMPFDKNGELIFDVEEARELHNNAVQMLSKAVGVDVLTTFADTEVESLSDKSTNTVSTDALSKVERGVFNEAGVSQMLFATDGNLALEKSVANDESIMFNLLDEYENFLNLRVNALFNKGSKKLFFKVFMPRLTIYNFKEMAGLYKDQATLGFSKMLPAIALGQSQSSILATVHFENSVLKLSDIMVPLQSSNTQSGKGSEKAATSPDDNSGGRPEKPDDQKSEKTIQNKQSQN
jgi:hypothetical protein